MGIRRVFNPCCFAQLKCGISPWSHYIIGIRVLWETDTQRLSQTEEKVCEVDQRTLKYEILMLNELPIQA
jgi:hypothetical protein